MEAKEPSEYLLKLSADYSIQGHLFAYGDRRFQEGKVAGNKEAYECGVYNGKADGIAEGMRDMVNWIDKTFQKDITINQMMATEAWQTFKESGLL